MPFCNKCGAENQPGTKFCAKCGNAMEPAVTATASIPAAAPYVKANNDPSFFQKLMDTKDSTATMLPADINANKVIAFLAYLGPFLFIFLNWFNQGFLGLIITAGCLVAPCLKAKDSPFVMYHLTRAILMFFAVLIVCIIDGFIAWGVYSLIYTIFVTISWELVGAGVVVGTILSWLFHIVIMAIPGFLLVLGALNCFNGKAKDLPLINKVHLYFGDEK